MRISVPHRLQIPGEIACMTRLANSSRRADKETTMAQDHDGPDRCILEVDGRAAGILLRENDGAYRFFAAEPGTAVLDRRTFRSPRRAEAEVKRVLRHDAPKR